MTDYEAYQNYLALKLHFSSEYDFHKYNGKVSATIESFEKRKDKYKFVRLSRKLSDPQILDFYLANFIRGKEWIGDFDEKNWLNHKKIVQSLQYFYENDLEKLLTSSDNFDILFKCKDGNHPKLIKAYLGKKITLETLVILEKVLQYRKSFQKWANDVCLKKLQELSDELASKYNQKKHRNRNWKTELGRTREEVN